MNIFLGLNQIFVLSVFVILNSDTIYNIVLYKRYTCRTHEQLKSLFLFYLYLYTAKLNLFQMIKKNYLHNSFDDTTSLTHYIQ